MKPFIIQLSNTHKPNEANMKTWLELLNYQSNICVQPHELELKV